MGSFSLYFQVCLVMTMYGIFSNERTEILRMLKVDEFVIKEFVFQRNTEMMVRAQNQFDICCDGTSIPCSQTSCRLLIVAFCGTDGKSLLIFSETYKINEPIRGPKDFTLKALNCFRKDMYIAWVTEVTRHWYEEYHLPLDRPARKIFKLQHTPGSSAIEFEYLFTQNCDVLYGPICETECQPQNKNQRCDPITGKTMCRLLYSGPNCLEVFDPCKSNTCLNRGKCISHEDYYTCECVNGYTGDSCENKPCSAVNCMSGTCLIGDSTCTCSELHINKGCQTRVCPKNYCYNQGTCQTNGLAIWCNCEGVNALGSRCEQKCVPECVHGKCDIIMNRPFCVCNPGYIGETCNVYANINKCPIIDLCLHGGSCVDGRGQNPFHCNCPPMWTGRVCEIYACNYENCRKGLCAENNLCACNKNAFGELCQYESCSRDEACLNGGSCQQSSLYNVRCLCLRDFAGRRCEHKCAKGCGLYGRCMLTQYGPQCECDENHNGEDCSNLIENMECKKLGCLYKGLCTRNKFTYVCECNEYWTGRRCEIPTCSINNCERGVCLLNRGCMCVDGYVGLQCSSAICTSNYCSQYGICVSNGINLKCICDEKISVGERCELECSQKCINGKCKLTIEKVPKCECIEGYSGDNCDTRDYTMLISYVLGGVTGICMLIFIVSLIIFVAAKFCFKAEGNTENYIYRIDNAINKKDGNWDALKVMK